MVLQIQARTDFKMLPLATQTSPIQHGDHSDDELCVGPVDTVERTRKTILSRQRNMLRLIIQTKKTCRKKTKASYEKEWKEEVNGKNNQEDKKGKEGKKLSQEAQMKKLKTETIQLQIMTKTATSPS